jgi:zinc/manganese transport system substrate-binding protein
MTPLSLVVLALSGCSSPLSSTGGRIDVIGAESQYSSVLRQIGGRYVSVSSILDNPSTDPHAFEASPRIASEVYAARLIVQNGAGYDGFMNKIEAQVGSSSRTVLVAQKILGVPAAVTNPHLWYAPRTMPRVAGAIAAALSGLQPAHRKYFGNRLRRFDRSLRSWLAAIASFKSQFDRTPVATTEPVADYLLQAMGARNLTPFRFQADVMNGIDPSPQDLAHEDRLLRDHRVKLLCYNAQVLDPLTTAVLRLAKKTGVPVVAVYETMPTPGYDYQSWMLAETRAIQRAVSRRLSTSRL